MNNSLAIQLVYYSNITISAYTLIVNPRVHLYSKYIVGLGNTHTAAKLMSFIFDLAMMRQEYTPTPLTPYHVTMHRDIHEGFGVGLG